MASTDAVLTRLLTSLSLADPTWDVSVGSATYKIMESVAQELATTSNNSTLLTYGLDINSKFGTELDAFVNLFGINRQLGTRATGTVTFSSQDVAVQNYDIPLGTQIYAPSSVYSSNINFTTTSPAIIGSGQQSVIVPIIATLPGTFANLPAGSVTQIGTPLVGTTFVVNEYNLSNGTDTETDVQLKQRFYNTAFSNFSGTSDKFGSVALQDPNVSQARVVGTQQRYSESLQVNTVISGNARFDLGFNVQAKLIITSGSNTATSYLGQLQPNITIPVSGTDPGSIYSGSILYDGTNYLLTGAAPTASGFLYVNYVASGTPTAFNGTSTASTIATEINSKLSSLFSYNNVIATVTGTISGSNTIASGLNITFSQPIPWNLIVNSGSPTDINTVVSQIPDSKYCYPQGNEAVGLNLGTNNQVLFNHTDYNYIRPSGTAPLHLKVTFNPQYANAPYTYTGQNVQLESEYIPVSSRITVTDSGTVITNPNIVDIFIDGTATQQVTEQAVIITTNTITASGGGGTYDAGKFLVASGSIPPSGDYYINLSQGPLANFPAQVISGNVPSTIVFGQYSFPVALNPYTTPITIAASGSLYSNILTTSTSISGLAVGLVISGTSGAPTISGIGKGNYITSLIPGNPNQIVLKNVLSVGVSGSTRWVGVAYPVYDNTLTAGSVNDITGIALRQSDPTGDYDSSWPANTNYSTGTFVHSYYSDVVIVDSLEQQSRTVGTDLLVHEAQYLNLQVNLSLVYDTSISPDVTNSSVQSAVSQYLSLVPFGGTVSLNSLLQAVYNINGVWSARISTSADNSTNYGLRALNIDGSNVDGPITKDILLNANQLARLYSINFNQYGQNNF